MTSTSNKQPGPRRLTATFPYMDRQDAKNLAREMQRSPHDRYYRFVDIRLENDPTNPGRARVIAVSELVQSRWEARKT